jgi:hypothetical protein
MRNKKLDRRKLEKLIKLLNEWKIPQI